MLLLLWQVALAECNEAIQREPTKEKLQTQRIASPQQQVPGNRLRFVMLHAPGRYKYRFAQSFPSLALPRQAYCASINIPIRTRTYAMPYPFSASYSRARATMSHEHAFPLLLYNERLSVVIAASFPVLLRCSSASFSESSRAEGGLASRSIDEFVGCILGFARQRCGRI